MNQKNGNDVTSLPLIFIQPKINAYLLTQSVKITNRYINYERIDVEIRTIKKMQSERGGHKSRGESDFRFNIEV